MKHHQTNSFISRAAMMLLTVIIAFAGAQTAWAQTTETVSYIDADGTQKSVTATVLTGDITQSGFELNDFGKPLMPAGWYVVKNSNTDGVDASCTKEIKATGDQGTIHIILADGAEMTVNGGSYGFNLDTGYPLAIYGQSAGTGRLTVSSSLGRAILSNSGVTINGGIVSATSSRDDAIQSNVTINGGQVTATGDEKHVGIRGTSTLGYRKLTDFIKSNGFNGSVTIKSGQTLYDGTTAYSGTLSTAQRSALANSTLRPFSSDDLAVNDDNTEYTIKTATGWGLFCDMLAQSDKGVFSGKTVLLGNDIEVSRMAGSQYHDFCGTFDGQGNTLTFNYSGSDTERIGPFSYISNVNSVAAVIRRLNVVADITSSGQKVGGIVGEAWGTLTIEHCTVSGTITTSKQFAGGIIGSASNTPLNITDCHSSVTISSSISGDGTHGGFAGRVPSSATLNISGCVFDGKIITTSGTNDCGGFVGHSENTAGNNVTITNSLYAPADIDDGETEALTGNVENDPSCTFARNVIAENITNSYYTRLLGTAQGKQALSATASPVGEATQTYSVSGITAYAKGITLDNGTDPATFYYGQGDEVAVSYTLPDGTTAPEPATATVLGGNAEGGADLAAGSYLVASDITYTGTVYLDGDATLILADGCTMNVGTSESRINGHGIKGYDFDRDTGYNLTITSQTAGTGAVNVYVTGAENCAIGGKKLTINGGNITADTDGNSGNAIAAVSNLTINGGNVTANASGNDAQAIASASDITINGGTVNATGDLAGIAATSNVTINGGNVNTTATANADSYGIATNGTITLGWTRATDRITASSYGGTVSVATADGHKLYDGNGNFLSGTVSDLAALNGKTLRPAATATYTTADGTTDTADAILLDGTEGVLGQDGEETWYFVGADISYSSTIGCYGNVNIILADGYTMTVNNNDGIFGVGDPNDILTIYGQTLGTGTLDITAYTYGINYGFVVIRGGTVNATGTNAYGIFADGNVTITGGQVTATGNIDGIFAGGNVTITGGQVTATSNSDGIFAGGDITLGCTNASDFIKATSYYVGDGKSVNIASGQTLYDEDGKEYSGDVFVYYDLAGKTLRPLPNVLALDDAADNSAAITANDRETRNVILYGRTLYKDGAWNTLCLPFALGDDQAESGHELDGTPLEGATLMTLGNSPACNTGFDPQTGTLNLDFLPATTVEPGVAYIVKWPIPDGMTADDFAAAYAANPDAYDLKNPVFTGVTVTNDAPADHATTSDDTYVTFVGTYGPAPIYADPATALYLGAANKLYWPTATDFELKPFRAYFQLNNGLTAGDPSNPNAARAITLNFGDSSESTGIVEITDPTPGPSPAWEGSAAGWYSMDGRKLQAQPTKPGLYIHGGKKVVVP